MYYERHKVPTDSVDISILKSDTAILSSSNPKLFQSMLILSNSQLPASCPLKATQEDEEEIRQQALLQLKRLAWVLHVGLFFKLEINGTAHIK